MKLIVVLLLFAAVLASRPKWRDLSESYSFEDYQRDFRKEYFTIAEQQMRKGLFLQTLTNVLAHNSAAGSTYRKGINHLSDLTQGELQRMRGARVEPSYHSKREKKFESAKMTAIAPTVDYRTSVPAVLTAVKDQGFCGDCWAHAVTEAVESAYAIATGELYVLSQQQVTSCTPMAGSCYSCNGSFPTLAYDYVADAGLTEEWIYPFESYNATFPLCRKNPTANPGYPLKTAVNISGYFAVGTNSQQDMEQALNDLGPLSILVDASTWNTYESGVFNDCDYSKNISMDHAVDVVGYGTDPQWGDYWIVRNSWSPAWGEQGYIRLSKPKVAQCGWNVGAAYSSGCYNVGPEEVWTCGTCGILFSAQYPMVLK